MAQIIKVRAVPNAPKSEVAGKYLDAVKIKIAAPAVEGKANAELVRFLSGLLNLPKSAVSIKSGDVARIKIVEIDADEAVLCKILASAKSKNKD